MNTVDELIADLVAQFPPNVPSTPPQGTPDDPYDLSGPAQVIMPPTAEVINALPVQRILMRDDITPITVEVRHAKSELGEGDQVAKAFALTLFAMKHEENTQYSRQLPAMEMPGVLHENDETDALRKLFIASGIALGVARDYQGWYRETDDAFICTVARWTKLLVSPRTIS